MAPREKEETRFGAVTTPSLVFTSLALARHGGHPDVAVGSGAEGSYDGHCQSPPPPTTSRGRREPPPPAEPRCSGRGEEAEARRVPGALYPTLPHPTPLYPTLPHSNPPYPSLPHPIPTLPHPTLPGGVHAAAAGGAGGGGETEAQAAAQIPPRVRATREATSATSRISKKETGCT